MGKNSKAYEAGYNAGKSDANKQVTPTRLVAPGIAKLAEIAAGDDPARARRALTH